MIDFDHLASEGFMPLRDKPIVVVGSVNMDLAARTPHIPTAGETVSGYDFQTHPGGKGGNQAVAIARLGHPVHLIGRVGTDDFGDQLRGHLASAGVDLSALQTSEGPSGVAIIVVSDAGENSIVVVPGANALLKPQDIDDHRALVRSSAMVLTQLETPLETVLHLAVVCEQEGVPLMLDPAPARKLPGELLQKVTWFTPNETEAAFYASATSTDSPSSIARKLMDQGTAKVLLKLGAKGAYIADGGGAGEAIKPYNVKAVDTTAAGDCFNGAFATALCRGKGRAESARYAAAAAAIAVTRLGAQPSMPNSAEVQAMLNRDAAKY